MTFEISIRRKRPTKVSLDIWQSVFRQSVRHQSSRIFSTGTSAMCNVDEFSILQTFASSESRDTISSHFFFGAPHFSTADDEESYPHWLTEEIPPRSPAPSTVQFSFNPIAEADRAKFRSLMKRWKSPTSKIKVDPSSFRCLTTQTRGTVDRHATVLRNELDHLGFRGTVLLSGSFLVEHSSLLADAPQHELAQPLVK